MVDLVLCLAGVAEGGQWGSSAELLPTGLVEECHGQRPALCATWETLVICGRDFLRVCQLVLSSSS